MAGNDNNGVKITDLPESVSFDGLYTLGSNAGKAYKVSLSGWEAKRKEATAAAEAANTAARTATEAAAKVKDGTDGKTPVIGIGTVTDAASASATLVADGKDTDGNPKYKLNLSLPKGSKGDPGKDGTDGTNGTDGTDGTDGKTPVIGIGTVTTVADTASASATLVEDGTDENGNPKYKLNLALPKGEKGLPGTGSGNVSADGAGLVKDRKYLFVPSANDSTEGVFVEYAAPEVVAKAKRLETAREFRLRGGAVSEGNMFDGTGSCPLDVTKLDESYLVNGTKSGFLTTLVDILMRNVAGHNALAYVNPDAITIEYSRDGGVTWAEYVDTTATEAELAQYTQKKKIVTSHRGASYAAQASNARFFLGKADMSENRQTSQYQLRVTLDFHQTTLCARYIKSYINFGTGAATGNTVDLEWMPDGGTAWKALTTNVAINGWTGWNTLSGFAINNHMASQSADASKARYMRWTFRTGGLTTADSTYSGAWVSNIFLIPEVNYGDGTPPMARYGTVNDADCYENMILPQSLKLQVPSGSAWTRQITPCANDNWQSSLGGMFFQGTGRIMQEIALLLAGKGVHIDSAGNVTMTDGTTSVKKMVLPNGCTIEQSGTDAVKLGANEILLEQGDNDSAAFTGTYNGYRQGGMKTIYRSGTDSKAVTYFYSNSGGVAIFNTGEVRFRSFMTDEDFYKTPEYDIDANWSTIGKVAKLVFAGGVEMIGGNPLMVVNATNGYVTLERGKLFVISGQTTIDISVPAETDGFAGEYNAEIVTGETAPTVSFPASLKWDGGEAPAFEANKTYHIVIFRGVGYCSQGA